jgi:hypothetical protein
MSATLLLPPVSRERLTPHDLVTYYRCPHEMELAHALRQAHAIPGEAPPTSLTVRTPANVVPLMHSPLAALPFNGLPFNDGRLDIFPNDTLVYEDEGEVEELPMLFASEQVRPDAQFRQHAGNLIDDELGMSGRPDFIIRRGDGSFVPVEYKATHPFHGLHDTHGRSFDLIQLLAECRLVEATVHRRPPYGILLYGDVAGSGAHEGWIQLPYGVREDAWIRSAAAMIRGDAVRPPVPSEGTCSTCPPHRDGLCRYAASRYSGSDERRERFHQLRY